MKKTKPLPRQNRPNAWHLLGWSVAVGVAALVLWPGQGKAVSDAQIAHLYDYSVQGQGVNGHDGSTVSLHGYDTAMFYVDLKNEGTATWEQDGLLPLRIGTDQPRDVTSPLNSGAWPSATRPALVSQKVTTRDDGTKEVSSSAKIAPGETGRFSFTIKAPNVTTTYDQHVQPVVENFTWLPRDLGIFWRVNITGDAYNYQWLDQSGSVASTPSTPSTLSLTVKNTSSVSWTNTGDSRTVRLGTFRSADRQSPLKDSTWQSGTRAGSFAGKARLDEQGHVQKDGAGNVLYDQTSTIAPGEAAYFTYSVKTPNTPYVANEYFNLVVENKTWLNDAGIYWPVSVGQGYAAQWAGQSAFPTITKAQSNLTTLSFDFKNTGQFTWYKDGPVRLAPTNPRDRRSSFSFLTPFSQLTENLPGGSLQWLSPSRVGPFSGKVNGDSLDLNASSIAPGETGRFLVTLDATSVNPGTYREYFSLVADGFAWLKDDGAFQAVTVRNQVPPTPTPVPSAAPTLPAPPVWVAPSVPPVPPTPSTPSTSSVFTSNRLFVDQNSRAKQQADEWRGSRPADASQIDKIASQSHAEWFGGWSGDIAAAVQTRTDQIRQSGGLPVYVAYNIPQRDCGGFSAGGANTPDGYRQWISSFANGLGSGPSAIILEPDGLGLTDCLSAADQQTRYDLLHYAVQTLRSHGASVYLDAGHAGWHSPSDMADRLNRAGIADAAGFSLNVSNFDGTASEAVYATQISALTGGKHVVIDTSRNGLGATADNQWCNPAGRALGQHPGTGSGVIDAYLWIKAPGESDGTCNGGPGAGQWWADYALGLAQRAAY